MSLQSLLTARLAKGHATPGGGGGAQTEEEKAEQRKRSCTLPPLGEAEEAKQYPGRVFTWGRNDYGVKCQKFPARVPSFLNIEYEEEWIFLFN
jgi:hypothetical protein